MRTHMACCNAHEKKLTYLRRFARKNMLIGEERVAERLVYSIFFATHAGERRSATGVEWLVAALENKRIEASLHAGAEAQALDQFKQQWRRRTQPQPRQHPTNPTGGGGNIGQGKVGG
jgi:hypothetical protein